MLPIATSNAYSCAQDSLEAVAENVSVAVVDYHTLHNAVCNQHCCNLTKGGRP